MQATPFEIGQIKAHVYHGLEATAIAPLVRRANGKKMTKGAVQVIMRKLRENPKWRGERLGESGKKRKTTKEVDQQIVDYTLENRGQEKVTVKVLKREIPDLRQFGDSLVQRRLHEAGLKSLPRRAKSHVETKYIANRLAFARWVLSQSAAYLARWAYTDGTVFYLDRSPEELEQSQRRALGKRVWRMADGSDGLWDENIGASAYNKAQGRPVRVWGLFANGLIHIWVLEPGDVMNMEIFSELVQDEWPELLGECDLIVADFERCLRSEPALEAMKEIGVKMVPDYPVSSQDLNAIENIWGILRARLNETMPSEIEDRRAFVARLRATVRWLNWNRQKQMSYLAFNQKDRARDVIELEGNRTGW